MKGHANTNSQSNKQKSNASHDPTFSFLLIGVSLTADNLKIKILTINKIRSVVLDFCWGFYITSNKLPFLLFHLLFHIHC